MTWRVYGVVRLEFRCSGPEDSSDREFEAKCDLYVWTCVPSRFDACKILLLVQSNSLFYLRLLDEEFNRILVGLCEGATRCSLGKKRHRGIAAKTSLLDVSVDLRPSMLRQHMASIMRASLTGSFNKLIVLLS
jgi:hypothetical protein